MFRGSITLVGGGKGGTGKSLLSMAIIDYWRMLGQPVILIEAETTNSDVYLTYAPLLGRNCAYSLDLMQGAGGWHELGDIVERHTDHNFVINTPAGMAGAYERFGELIASLDTITGRFTTLWPINRLRDSVQLLARYTEAVPGARVAVVKNLFFGEAHRFRRFDRSEFLAKRPKIKVGELPELDDDLIDILDERVPIEQIADRTTLLRRFTMAKWRNEVHAMLGSLL